MVDISFCKACLCFAAVRCPSDQGAYISEQIKTFRIYQQSVHLINKLHKKLHLYLEVFSLIF